MLERIVRDDTICDHNILLSLSFYIKLDTFKILCEHGFSKDHVLYYEISSYDKKPDALSRIKILLNGKKYKNQDPQKRVEYRANVNEKFGNETVLEYCTNLSIFKLLLHYGAKFYDRDQDRMLHLIENMIEKDYTKWNVDEYIKIIKIVIKRKLLDFDESIFSKLLKYIDDEKEKYNTERCNKLREFLLKVTNQFLKLKLSSNKTIEEPIPQSVEKEDYTNDGIKKIERFIMKHGFHKNPELVEKYIKDEKIKELFIKYGIWK